MTIAIIAAIIGVMILAAGIYYLAKEKSDRESRRIYIITSIVGAVILAAALLKMLA